MVKIIKKTKYPGNDQQGQNTPQTGTPGQGTQTGENGAGTTVTPSPDQNTEVKPNDNGVAKPDTNNNAGATTPNQGTDTDQNLVQILQIKTTKLDKALLVLQELLLLILISVQLVPWSNNTKWSR